MALFVVTFGYAADPAALAALRPSRYDYFADLEARGALLASGQLVDGPLGDGLLVLDAADEGAARQLLADDPYARAGYVARLDLARWRPTTGAWVRR